MLNFLRSQRAFYVIVALFIFEALWIALTARYPMAFDEYARFGVIELHTTTWLPFLSNVPDSASLYGAVTRDPSFMYDYIMSFPLRGLQLITDSQVWQILGLRILNIGIAVAALFVYRKLILAIGASRLATNLILLFLILIPVMPLMAGQITYDNMFFLFIATTFLLTVRFVQAFQKNKTINVDTLNWLLLVGLFTCYIKYPFIPALFGIVLSLVILLRKQPRQLGLAYKKWWSASSRRYRSLVIGAAVVMLGLFAGSYGLNMVRYHTPLPECDTVLSVEACLDYGPWGRDHRLKAAGGSAEVTQLPWYVQKWVRQMMMETFFMVGAQYDERGIVVYYSSPPIKIMFITAWVLFVAGISFAIWQWRRIWKHPVYRLLFVSVGIYTLALLARNMQFYLETGSPVAIHGRYVLPFIPPLVAVLAVLAAERQRLQLSERAKLIAIGVTVLLFLQGGGLITYIVSTSDRWMWPQSQPAQDINEQARKLISPLIIK